MIEWVVSFNTNVCWGHNQRYVSSHIHTIPEGTHSTRIAFVSPATDTSIYSSMLCNHCSLTAECRVPSWSNTTALRSAVYSAANWDQSTYVISYAELCATSPNTELCPIAIESKQLGSCTWIALDAECLSIFSKWQQAKDDNGDCKLKLNMESKLV